MKVGTKGVPMKKTFQEAVVEIIPLEEDVITSSDYKVHGEFVNEHEYDPNGFEEDDVYIQ
jgi:hypothetical protein